MKAEALASAQWGQAYREGAKVAGHGAAMKAEALASAQTFTEPLWGTARWASPQ